jgi:hypothetical protein
MVNNQINQIPDFDRNFYKSKNIYSCLGNGEVGGKAHGLIKISDILKNNLNLQKFPGFQVSIPRLVVIKTNVFDEFMKRNNLYETIQEEMPDDRIAYAFQKANLPPGLDGDLYTLISQVNSPIAVRSSSLLEDSLYKPFAGIYATKMTANNQFDTESKFRKIIEAIKFVYASLYFKRARSYFQAIRHNIEEEKMAVILQEVVGKRYTKRFYPEISGVARSFNFYTSGHAKPEDGIVNLALGLGKTIVDDGISWSYSPAYPQTQPPYNSIRDLMNQTQNEFWCINMGEVPFYDPIAETEYLLKRHLNDALEDNTLRYLASFYDQNSDRIYPGVSSSGFNIINFAPVLHSNQIPLNDLIKEILFLCEQAYNVPIEIEFAVTLPNQDESQIYFGFLQIRPMVVSTEEVDITKDELENEDVIVKSDYVLGNGTINNITNIVFVKPEEFKTEKTQDISKEIGQLNKKLVKNNTPYILIGFGRWGSSDPHLGIPVNWEQISGAKVIVESTLPEINVELSQGSHFFHNLTSFQISYFSIRHAGKYKINWSFLNQQKVFEETLYVKHIKLLHPLIVKVDGRSGKGVILK